MFKKLLVLLLFSASASAAPSTGYFVDKGIPTEVVAAHESFLGGDFNQMGVNIKRALMAYPDDAGIKKDMLGLFSQAYQLRGDGAITPDYRLPREITWAAIGSRKRLKAENGEIQYRMTAWFEMALGTSIEQLRIVRYPNTVVLDRQAGVGDFTETVEAGKPALNTYSEYTNTPNAEGLYLLELTMKGAAPIQGWFILANNNAPDSPEVLVPVLHQEFTTSTPTFQWQDFVSSLYRGFEKRKTVVAATPAKAPVPGAKDDGWSMNRKSGFTQARVGDVGEGISGVGQLKSGEYTFQLTYRERLHFGDLVIGRETATHVPFSVK